MTILASIKDTAWLHSEFQISFCKKVNFLMQFLLRLWGIMGLLCLFSLGNLRLSGHILNYFSQAVLITLGFAQMGTIFSIENSVYFYRSGRNFKCFKQYVANHPFLTELSSVTCKL